MLRSISLMLALFAMCSAGLAFDAEATIQQYNATRPECRQGETLGGSILTPEQSAEACERLNEIGAELKANNYCFDQAEQEWAVCKQ